MANIKKLVDKFLANPTSIRFAQLVRVLEHFSFLMIKPKSGSHYKFKHDKLREDLVIPVHNGECKDFYKKEAKKYIHYQFLRNGYFYIDSDSTEEKLIINRTVRLRDIWGRKQKWKYNE